MIYKVINKTKGEVLVSQAKLASSFWQRLRGLMFRKTIGVEEGLIFYQAGSIHTCFMRFAIDVVFADRDLKVVKLYSELKPWRLAGALLSHMTLELPAGKIAAAGVAVGDILELKAEGKA